VPGVPTDIRRAKRLRSGCRGDWKPRQLASNRGDGRLTNCSVYGSAVTRYCTLVYSGAAATNGLPGACNQSCHIDFTFKLGE
jgi:hypothetical protein